MVLFPEWDFFKFSSSLIKMVKVLFILLAYLLSFMSVNISPKNNQYQGNICDALRDLVPFVQFKKREKHPWRSVNFSKVAG